VLVDYVSLELTKAMVGRGGKATLMRDKKGYLPLHVAVSRHVSPDKLRLLLDANPSALLAQTNDGQTALALAKTTATESHPNYALIKALEEEIQLCARVASLDVAAVLPARVGSTDTIDVTPKGSGKKQKKSRKSRKTPTSPAKRIKMENSGLPSIETPAAANLLLHFSRNSNVTLEVNWEEPEMEVFAVKVEECEMVVVAV
jgi:Ankyrin repeats (many copies)